MLYTKIKLSSLPDVKCFVNAANQCSFDIDVINGRYIIDGKSIMGMFSLDMTKLLEVHVHADMKKDEAELQSFANAISHLVSKE